MFNPDDFYISISKNAGKDIKELGLVRDGNHFDDFRKVIVAALAGSYQVGEQEIHIMVVVTAFDVDLGLWCIVKSGSPAGNRKQTVTVMGVVDKDNVESTFRNARKNKNYLHLMYRQIKKDKLIKEIQHRQN